MINHLHLARWADVLVRYATDVQPGNIVRITAQPAAEPLLEAVYRKVLEAGGIPIVNCRPESLTEAFYELANEQQLDWENPLAKLETEIIDATINLAANTNLRSLKMGARRTESQIAVTGQDSSYWCSKGLILSDISQYLPYGNESRPQAECPVNRSPEGIIRRCGIRPHNRVQAHINSSGS